MSFNYRNRLHVPQFAYICDTSIDVFLKITEETRSWLQKCPVIIIECTYLDIKEDKSDSCEEAKKRGHICWTQLRPIIEKHKDITWILFHFSQGRYVDNEILSYFKTLEDEFPNIKVWLKPITVE